MKNNQTTHIYSSIFGWPDRFNDSRNYLKKGKSYYSKPKSIVVHDQYFETHNAAAKHYGIDNETLRRRLKNLPQNPSCDEINSCFKPVKNHSRNTEPITVFDKQYSSVTAACKYLRRSQSTVQARLKKLTNPTVEQINHAFREKK